MKEYLTPYMEIVKFKAEDVITTSDGAGRDDYVPPENPNDE